jgi:phenylacetic acid degradation operon negative regulatory protein
MARTHTESSVSILDYVATLGGESSVEGIYKEFIGTKSRKAVYDNIFRLVQQGLLEYRGTKKDSVAVTEDGKSVLLTRRPERDGIWKMVIFDIPEKQRPVRTFLRNRLRSLGFKKWQASIWISPYKLDERIELELKQLAEKLFVRLIKTTDINYSHDIEQMFADKE